MIRKIQFAPASNKAGPKADIAKQFMMTDKPLNVEASLEKEVHQSLQTQCSAWYIRYKVLTRNHSYIQIYYHGDPITVKVKVNNETSKVVKKIKISGEQWEVWI